MSKAKRLARLDDRRIELEAEYHEALIAALRVTAGGQWGLFDHHQDRHTRANAAPTVNHLCELGDDINAMREELSLEPYALHAEFLASRGPVSSHAVGEPKQAQAWLDRLKSA
jgi:hypothetical protein